jgi:hypothetical protein
MGKFLGLYSDTWLAIGIAIMGVSYFGGQIAQVLLK